MYFSTWPRYFSNAGIEVTSVFPFGRLVYPSSQHNGVIVGRGGGRFAHCVCLASKIPRTLACYQRKRGPHGLGLFAVSILAYTELVYCRIGMGREQSRRVITMFAELSG